MNKGLFLTEAQIIKESLRLQQVKEVPEFKEAAEDLANLLRTLIQYHEKKYYIDHSPVIADAEYDHLFNLLKKIEKRYPELITPYSPTQRVSSELTKEFPEVSHYTPMLSLENAYTLDDLYEFERKVKEALGESSFTYVVEPKFDGAGIALVYEDDILQRGATRGDGEVGEDITNNLKTIKTIPLYAPFSQYNIKKIEIRGEVIMPKKALHALNEERIKEGLSPFANTRNAASGSLHLQDPRIVAQRNLIAFVYQITYAVDSKGNNLLGTGVLEPLQLHFNCLKLLEKIGFNAPVKFAKVCENINEVYEWIQKWEVERKNLEYDWDGMVVKVNEMPFYDTLGATSHHPRWALAFKFKAQQATSKIISVSFQVGRVGTITPVAKIQPVELEGVKISSISMFNEDFIKEKDILIGDTVLIERAGGVIPYIVKVIKEARTGNEIPVVFPEKCPACNYPLYREEGEAAWRCLNIECPAQILERLIHFTSRDAMNIEHLGEKTLKKFYELGFIKSISDIYKLDYNKIANVYGFGEKSASNIKKAVENSKYNPLYRLIYALGIRYVGVTTAEKLASKVSSIKDFFNWTIEDFMKVEDIGPKVANSLYNFFSSQNNREIILELESLGVNIRNTSVQRTGVLNGCIFLFTGTLEKMTRSKAQEIVASLGASVVNTFTSKVTHLVVGANPGSKLQKAQKFPTVKIITEKEFYELLEKNGVAIESKNLF